MHWSFNFFKFCFLSYEFIFFPRLDFSLIFEGQILGLHEIKKFWKKAWKQVQTFSFWDRLSEKRFNVFLVLKNALKVHRLCAYTVHWRSNLSVKTSFTIADLYISRRSFLRAFRKYIVCYKNLTRKIFSNFAYLRNVFHTTGAAVVAPVTSVLQDIWEHFWIQQEKLYPKL